MSSETQDGDTRWDVTVCVRDGSCSFFFFLHPLIRAPIRKTIVAKNPADAVLGRLLFVVVEASVGFFFFWTHPGGSTGGDDVVAPRARPRPHANSLSVINDSGKSHP